MSDLKRYWIVIHYETDLTAESEWHACHDICMGNTIVENASIIAREIPSDADTQALITDTRLAVRKKAAISIILHQLSYKLEDYSLCFDGLPPDIQKKLEMRSLEEIEDLSIAVLDFNSLNDLIVAKITMDACIDMLPHRLN